MSVTGLMPGMALHEQLNQLAAARGVEPDVLKMRRTIPQLQSGVERASWLTACPAPIAAERLHTVRYPGERRQGSIEPE